MVIDDLLKSKRLAVNPSMELLMDAMDHLHTGHGYRLMKHWNLPEKYAEVSKNHHDATPELEDYLTLSVRLADKACNKMGIGVRPDTGLMLMATPEANELHLSEVDIAKMEIMLEDSQALGGKN
jgi:HD-like signal output (HDOD) protein